MSATLMPAPRQRFVDNVGNPLVNGMVLTFDAGTSTPRAAYTDPAMLVPHANPIRLDERGEATVYWSGNYKVNLRYESGVQVPGYPVDNFSTLDLNAASDALRADLQAAGGGAKVSTTFSGTQVKTRTVEDKLREVPSLNDFLGLTDDARFLSAKANGTKWLRIPAGIHNIGGWSFADGDALSNLVFDPGAQLIVAASANAIGLDIQKSLFNIYGCADVKSAGTKSDSNNMIGIRCGNPTIVGKAYIFIDALRVENFSKRGFVFYQPVYCSVRRAVSLNCTYGLSIEPANGVGGSTVEIGPSYNTGCTRGINLEMCSWVTLREPITEYCGSSTTIDGALHFKAVGSCTVIDRYGEQNGRNMVKDDGGVVFINGSTFAATAPDVVTYTGAAFSDRGTTSLLSKAINARRIDFDIIDNEDLTIGLNLVVPKTGGSVSFGGETQETRTGVLTSGAWTPVKVIPPAEMSGANQERAFYEYVAYAGSGDQSGPQPAGQYDAGTIMNGVLRSYSGAVPAWLRLNVITTAGVVTSVTFEMNVTSTTYGLNYVIGLRRRKHS